MILNLTADRARNLTKENISQGYDLAMRHIEKDIKRAIHIGLYETTVAILPWIQYNDKHKDLLTSLGYEVKYNNNELFISWR